MQDENHSGTTKRFLKSGRQCNTFYPTTSKYVSTSNPQNRMYTVNLLNITVLPAVHFFSAHDARLRIHGKYDFLSVLSLLKDVHTMIFFTAFRNRLLPPPYETKCRDYSATKYQSREHCIESCAVRLSLDQRSVFPICVSAAYDPLPVPYDQHFNLSILLMTIVQIVLSQSGLPHNHFLDNE